MKISTTKFDWLGRAEIEWENGDRVAWQPFHSSTNVMKATVLSTEVDDRGNNIVMIRIDGDPDYLSNAVDSASLSPLH